MQIKSAKELNVYQNGYQLAIRGPFRQQVGRLWRQVQKIRLMRTLWPWQNGMGWSWHVPHASTAEVRTLTYVIEDSFPTLAADAACW